MEFLLYFGWILISSLFLVCSLLTFKETRNTLANARYLETSTIGDIEQSIFDIESSEGKGYRHYCETKGNLKCDNPIKSEFTGKDMIWYTADIIAVCVSTYSHKNKDGKWETRQSISNVRMAYYSDMADFYITDSTSSNRLYIKSGNNLSGESTFKYTAYTEKDPLCQKFNIKFTHKKNFNTLRIEFKEEGFMPGDSIYAIGDAYYENDKLVLGAPNKKGAIGIVRTGNEDSVLKNQNWASKLWLTIAVINAIVLIFNIINLIRLFTS